jgi:hypothetical protein
MLRFKSHMSLTEARRNAHLAVQQKSDALQTLSKYKDDPSIHISYTKLNKIGINPKSKYPDTPLAVFTYPLMEIWNDIQKEGVGNVQFAATTSKYIFVLKEKTRPLMDVSKYTLAMLNADMKKLSKDIPVETINKIAAEIDKNMAGGPYSKKGDPFTYLRTLLYRLGIELKKKKAAVFMSSRLIELGYSGFSDRKGQGQIHPSEPIQAFFLSPSYYTVVDVIELKSLDLKDEERRDKASYLQKNASKMSDDEIVDYVKDDPELLKYAGPPRTEVLKQIVVTKGRPEIWKSKQYNPGDDYEGSDYVAAEKSFPGSDVLTAYKKLPDDFIKWSLENNVAQIGWWSWWAKKNNYKFDTKMLDELIKNNKQALNLYTKVDTHTAKIYYDKWNSISGLSGKMDDADFGKFLATVDYEIPEFSTYSDVIAKDIYKKLLAKNNPSDDDIVKVARYIQSAGERKVPMDLVNSVKSKFPNFDFTTIGRWDYWKR